MNVGPFSEIVSDHMNEGRRSRYTQYIPSEKRFLSFRKYQIKEIKNSDGALVKSIINVHPRNKNLTPEIDLRPLYNAFMDGELTMDEVMEIVKKGMKALESQQVAPDAYINGNYRIENHQVVFQMENERNEMELE